MSWKKYKKRRPKMWVKFREAGETDAGSPLHIGFITASAYHRLGRPEYLALHFNQDTMKIRIEAADESDVDALKLSRRRQFSACGFLKETGLDEDIAGSTLELRPVMDDEIGGEEAFYLEANAMEAPVN